jgi:hypothetical protein
LISTLVKQLRPTPLTALKKLLKGQALPKIFLKRKILKRLRATPPIAVLAQVQMLVRAKILMQKIVQRRVRMKNYGIQE